MIRDFKDSDKLVITVETLDGGIYEERDIPPHPLGNNESIVSFWDKDDLMCIPIVQIKEFYFTEQ